MRKGLEAVKHYILNNDASASGYNDDLLERMVWVNHEYDLVLLNYKDATAMILHNEGLQWTPFLRVCRGVVFTPSGELVSLPLHKFFNVKENEETSLANIANWPLRSATEKVDGVMIQVFFHPLRKEITYASRWRIWSDAAITAFKLANSALTNAVIPKLNASFGEGKWTLICELIHPEHRQPGMVSYGDLQALVLLYVRKLDDLELIPAVELFKDNELPPPLMLPQQYLIVSALEALEKVKQAKHANWEGIVVQGAMEGGNRLVKMKNPLYLEGVNAVKNLNRILKIYEAQGREGVENLFLLYASYLDDVPHIVGLRDLLYKTEDEINNYAKQLRESTQDVTTLPREWRWVKSYDVGNDKWQRCVRRMVLQKVNAGGRK